MGLLEKVPRASGGGFEKGRLCRCVATVPSEVIAIVRPQSDDASFAYADIPATICTIDMVENPFNHSTYGELSLKSDEEFVLQKAKRRPAVVLTPPSVRGFVAVVPIYTLKRHHERYYDLGKLRENRLPGIMYLPPDEQYSHDRFVSLLEQFAVHTSLAELMPWQLTREAIQILDDGLSDLYDVYADD